MDHTFWLERWERDQIGFHQAEVNAYLCSHWEELGLAEGAPVFVPLCGKSRDMLWLRSQGHEVLAVELSEKAVAAFFEENRIPPAVEHTERFSAYSAAGLKLLAGDFFALRPADLEGICAVYDRASLIALPPSMRSDYARHMATLLPAGAHILLITMEYADPAIEGPPFSVTEEEVRGLYGEYFSVERKALWEGVAGPRGATVSEKVYTLTRHRQPVG
ncbi:MAG: thiopurine S-methyltransferase [Pseudomonadota bacterium]